MATTNKALSSLEHGAGLDVVQAARARARARLHADLPGRAHRRPGQLGARLRAGWPPADRPGAADRHCREPATGPTAGSRTHGADAAQLPRRSSVRSHPDVRRRTRRAACSSHAAHLEVALDVGQRRPSHGRADRGQHAQHEQLLQSIHLPPCQRRTRAAELAQLAATTSTTRSAAGSTASATGSERPMPSSRVRAGSRRPGSGRPARPASARSAIAPPGDRSCGSSITSGSGSASTLDASGERRARSRRATPAGLPAGRRCRRAPARRTRRSARRPGARADAEVDDAHPAGTWRRPGAAATSTPKPSSLLKMLPTQATSTVRHRRAHSARSCSGQRLDLVGREVEVAAVGGLQVRAGVVVDGHREVLLAVDVVQHRRDGRGATREEQVVGVGPTYAGAEHDAACPGRTSTSPIGTASCLGVDRRVRARVPPRHVERRRRRARGRRESGLCGAVIASR